jgi:hypothetical protein
MTGFKIIWIVYTCDEKKRITHVGLKWDDKKFMIRSIISLMNNSHQFFTYENKRKATLVHKRRYPKPEENIWHSNQMISMKITWISYGNVHNLFFIFIYCKINPNINISSNSRNG